MEKFSYLLLPLLFFILHTPAHAQVQKWYQNDFSEDLGGWSEPDKSPNPPVIVDETNPFLQNESTGEAGAGGKWLMIMMKQMSKIFLSTCATKATKRLI